MKVGGSREFSYYCPDKKVWEKMGYYNKNVIIIIKKVLLIDF